MKRFFNYLLDIVYFVDYNIHMNNIGQVNKIRESVFNRAYIYCIPFFYASLAIVCLTGINVASGVFLSCGEMQ